MRFVAVVVAAVCLAACEDGPDQVFTPNKGDPEAQNGFKPKQPWYQDGEKQFDFSAGTGDSNQRAQFCDEGENEQLIADMVKKPIVPDVGLAGVPLWAAGDAPIHANDLIGRPTDGKFCDPDVYSDALSWGPTNEVIAFINPQTKLVESLVATSQYLGKLQGTFTNGSGTKVTVTVALRDQVQIGDKKLTQYASSTDQASKHDAWLNSKNITSMYRMLRETFFGATKIADNYDCVAAKVCDVIYTSPDESVRQNTAIVFQDSGVILAFSPEGHVQYVMIEPVRIAPFEVATSIDLVKDDGTFEPKLTSTSRANCTIDLSAGMTFADFKAACVDDTRTLNRATYDVHGQRDAVDVDFNGVTVTFLRTIAKGEVMHDGERPLGPETLQAISFTRTLNGSVDEFRPSLLGQAYKARLEARLKELVKGKPGHPFETWALDVPIGLSIDSQRIGELFYTVNKKQISWVPKVIQDVQAFYRDLPANQKPVAERVLDPIFILEPFVHAVLDQFTNKLADTPQGFTAFRTTDDRRWSIGEVHFVANGVPTRVQVQYSMNYGAVTAVSIERGNSQIDSIFQGINDKLRASKPYPYYDIDLASVATNPLGLWATGVTVTGVDRKLDTLDVTLPLVSTSGPASTLQLTVPGLHLDDRSGYNRQIRGERWEFVPAHQVVLNGKETRLTLYVQPHLEQNGATSWRIGRISQSTFKRKVTLCPGLEIAYGDDLKKAIQAWSQTAGTTAFRDCELVYNHSENGNVLYSVVSLTRKTQISTIADRAVSVAIWR